LERCKYGRRAAFCCKSTQFYIGLYDAASGTSVIVGAVKDCSAVLVGGKQVASHIHCLSSARL